MSRVLTDTGERMASLVPNTSRRVWKGWCGLDARAESPDTKFPDPSPEGRLREAASGSGPPDYTDVATSGPNHQHPEGRTSPGPAFHLAERVKVAPKGSKATPEPRLTWGPQHCHCPAPPARWVCVSPGLSLGTRLGGTRP